MEPRKLEHKASDLEHDVWESSSFLNPAIWSRLPKDIIMVIIAQSDTAMQKRWACVSSMYHVYACSRIWRHVRLSTKNPVQVLAALMYCPQKPFWEFICETSAGASNVKHSSFREHVWKRAITNLYNENAWILEAPLLGAHVRTLELDDWIGWQMLDNAISMLLPSLTGLISFQCAGAVGRATLEQLSHLKSVRRMMLRNTSMKRALPSDPMAINTYVSELGPPVSFEPLCQMKNLQILVIGRLRFKEAVPLAKTIPLLRLEELSIACAGWITETEIGVTRGTESLESPLIPFLRSLLSDGGFPRTLKTLCLSEVFYAKLDSVFQMVAATIQECKSLLRLTVNISLAVLAWKKIIDLGLWSYLYFHVVREWACLSSTDILRCAMVYWESIEIPRLTIPLPGPTDRPISNLARTLDMIIASPYLSDQRMFVARFSFFRNERPDYSNEADITMTYPCPSSRGFRCPRDDDIEELCDAFLSMKAH